MPTTEDNGRGYTAGKRRALRGGDRDEWARPGCGFVLAEDDKVIGRFPKYEDALLDAAAGDLLAAVQLLTLFADRRALAGKQGLTSGQLKNVMALARAAIAKAVSP